MNTTILNLLPQDSNSPLCQAICQPGVIEFLNDRSIDLVTEVDGYPDLVFLSANHARKRPIPANSVCFERTDGAYVSFRRTLNNQNCIAYVKMFCYASKNHHECECVRCRPMSFFLNHEHQFDTFAPKTPILESSYDKICFGPNFMHYIRNRRGIAKTQPCYLDTDRFYDVSFAGTVKYGNSEDDLGILVSEHREQICQWVERLQEECGLKVKVVRGRELGFDDYYELLLDSRVAVSPWGWGEYCYRDFEATLAGCSVVKPKSFPIDFIGSRLNDYFYWHNLQGGFEAFRDCVLKAVEEHRMIEASRIRSREFVANQMTDMAVGGAIYDIVMFALTRASYREQEG